MLPYTINISEKAERNILNIKYYIKYNLLSAQASEKFEADLFKKLDKIAKEPHLYENSFSENTFIAKQRSVDILWHSVSTNKRIRFI